MTRRSFLAQLPHTYRTMRHHWWVVLYALPVMLIAALLHWQYALSFTAFYIIGWIAIGWFLAIDADSLPRRRFRFLSCTAIVLFAYSAFVDLFVKPADSASGDMLSVWATHIICATIAAMMIADVHLSVRDARRKDDPFADLREATTYAGWALVAHPASMLYLTCIHVVVAFAGAFAFIGFAWVFWFLAIMGDRNKRLAFQTLKFTGTDFAILCMIALNIIFIHTFTDESARILPIFAQEADDSLNKYIKVLEVYLNLVSLMLSAVLALTLLNRIQQPKASVPALCVRAIDRRRSFFTQLYITIRALWGNKIHCLMLLLSAVMFATLGLGEFITFGGTMLAILCAYGWVYQIDIDFFRRQGFPNYAWLTLALIFVLLAVKGLPADEWHEISDMARYAAIFGFIGAFIGAMCLTPPDESNANAAEVKDAST